MLDCQSIPSTSDTTKGGPPHDVHGGHRGPSDHSGAQPLGQDRTERPVLAQDKNGPGLRQIKGYWSDRSVVDVSGDIPR